MDQIAANEDGVTVIRGKGEPCMVRWDELRSIECYYMEGVTCLDFNCAAGGFLSADSAVEGFGRVLKMLDVYVRIEVPRWRERVASLGSKEMAGVMISLYVREEAAVPEAAGSEVAGRFPRASGYDTQWLMDQAMGMNPLWLTEWLTGSMKLERGMRVLDLGCGGAASSIFLAKEFGVSVIAADVGVNPGENAVRIAAAGVENLVTPIYAEAHALPFSQNYFDAIVSINAYHYFGTDDLYLGALSGYLRPGGWLGVVVPTVKEEIGEEVPLHLRPYWNPEFCSFHAVTWWRQHWKKTGLVDVKTADALEGGAALWLEWADACAQRGPLASKETMGKEAEMLRMDAGGTFGFGRVVAQRR